jgi:hypothetical protein
MKEFYSRLESQSAVTLLPKELQTMFHLQTDPCERGSLIVDGTNPSNDGANSCSIQSRVGNAKFRLAVLIPTKLRGTWKARMNPMRLDFKDSDSAPVLRFL